MKKLFFYLILLLGLGGWLYSFDESELPSTDELLEEIYPSKPKDEKSRIRELLNLQKKKYESLIKKAQKKLEKSENEFKSLKKELEEKNKSTEQDSAVQFLKDYISRQQSNISNLRNSYRFGSERSPSYGGRDPYGYRSGAGNDFSRRDFRSSPGDAYGDSYRTPDYRLPPARDSYGRDSYEYDRGAASAAPSRGPGWDRLEQLRSRYRQEQLRGKAKAAPASGSFSLREESRIKKIQSENKDIEELLNKYKNLLSERKKSASGDNFGSSPADN